MQAVEMECSMPGETGAAAMSSRERAEYSEVLVVNALEHSGAVQCVTALFSASRGDVVSSRCSGMQNGDECEQWETGHC